MNNKLPISCFIIAKNEADRITKTIKSVEDLVDEIIVIDSGSTDGTQDLVKKLGCKLYYNEWPGFGPQKRFGEEKAKNKWLLNLDADEYLSNELKVEIRKSVWLSIRIVHQQHCLKSNPNVVVLRKHCIS